jgi:tyrosyl-tRNA synthetase
MSKSLGNHIPLNTTPEDMFGKVMSVPDVAMGSYFRLATRWGPDKVAELERQITDGGLHPRDAKLKLAGEIVGIYFGEEAAHKAEAEFRAVFQRGGEPEQMPRFALTEGATLLEVLLKAGLAQSKGQARRLIQQGGVRLDDQALSDPELVLRLHAPAVLRVGKRRFLRLIPPGN